jgi:hypothetical protein
MVSCTRGGDGFSDDSRGSESLLRFYYVISSDDLDRGDPTGIKGAPPS